MPRGIPLMDLNDLYRQVILDHNKSPRNFGTLDPCDASATGHNPLCGDRLYLSLRLDGDTVGDIAFNGSGCAISVASASMMTEAIKGHSRAEIAALYRDVHGLLTDATHRPTHELGKLQALGGVREFPVRVKCASLCWHTLNAALHPAAADVGAAGNSPTSTATAIVSTEQS
jgi:nitrogen fixation NifU-like protein